MKRLSLAILLFLSLNVLAQTNSNHPYRTIRTLVADLNNDHKADTILLISSLEGRNDFNRISISLTGYSKKNFNARDYWTVVDSNFLVKNKNAMHTKLLFLKSTEKHTVILLFGEMDGAGYRGEFSIINIENNNVEMVFDPLNTNGNEPDIEIPFDLVDLEHNGRLCFIYTTLHEMDGSSSEMNAQNGRPDIGSYAPYFVYKIEHNCQLDKPLSKKYMEDHYVFAGFKYNEDIRILYPADGSKPSIWKKTVFH